MLLRHLAAGLITSDAFDLEAVPLFDDADPAIWAVYEAAWQLYSDLRTYRLRGRHALTRDVKRNVARCIVFLYSDLEYEWPDPRTPKLHFLRCVITLGRAARRWRQDLTDEMRSIGSWDLWPFMRAADFEAERASPHLLSAPRV